MSDPVTRLAEKWLKDIKREFSLSFHKLGPTEIPALRVRISDHPPNPSDDVRIKEMMCTRPVFAELVKIVLDPDNLRVCFDEARRHPWFDLAYSGAEGSLIFHVAAVHPVRELKSSA
jgi:hypothetical protein